MFPYRRLEAVLAESQPPVIIQRKVLRNLLQRRKKEEVVGYYYVNYESGLGDRDTYSMIHLNLRPILT